MAGIFISVFIFVFLGSGIAVFLFMQYRKTLREAKNYERGLKMVPMLIHLPPSSDDIASSGRDERDLNEEILSQAQVMYNIIASTATKGFKSKCMASATYHSRLSLVKGWCIIILLFRSC
jgi:hypothetical protein